MPMRRLVGSCLLALLVMGFLFTFQGCKPADTDPAPGNDPVDPGGEDVVVVPEGTPYEFEVPLGLEGPPPVPEDNPMTVEKIALGKQLYFDTRLSADGTISCATCHDPTIGWAEHKPTSTGIDGQVGPRNSPTVINSAYAPDQFWDGRMDTLEEQALGPIENPIEMGHDLDTLCEELNEIEGYVEQFQAVFGTDVTEDGIAKAIAAFERTVISGNSAFDKYNAGDDEAMTEEQLAGHEVFTEANCAMCHTPPLFSRYGYAKFDTGVVADPPDEGRKDVTKSEADNGKFRTPILRDVADTAPYFHDGSAETLEDAVAIMAKSNTEEEQASLVTFLGALSGEYPIIDPPELP